jgi:hypothetical protein
VRKAVDPRERIHGRAKIPEGVRFAATVRVVVRSVMDMDCLGFRSRNA